MDHNRQVAVGTGSRPQSVPLIFSSDHIVIVTVNIVVFITAFVIITIDITTQEESHSGGTSVEFYTTVTLLSTLMPQR